MSVFGQFMQVCQAENRRLCDLLGQWATDPRLGERSELPLCPPPAQPFALAQHLLDLKAALPNIQRPFVTRREVAAARAVQAAQAAATAEADSSESPLRLSFASEEHEAPPSAPATAAPAAATPAQVGPRAEHPGEKSRKHINALLSRLGIEIVALHGGLLERLSDIVLESQLPRALLRAGDSFHVSGVSVMGALALANLAYLCATRQRMAPVIDMPMKIARLHADRFVNGDLLFWDLAARSAAAARRDNVFGDESQALLDEYFPAFLAHSVVAKLDLAFDFPIAVLERADYRTWPGLKALMVHPGAESIRSRVVGRLALRCAQNPTVGVVVAGLWIRAMFGLPGLETHAALLAARWLWELLEAKESALPEMIRQAKAAEPLRNAVKHIEALRQKTAPEEEAGQMDALSYLKDVASCLDSFKVYRGLCEMNRLAAPAEAAKVTAAEEPQS